MKRFLLLLPFLLGGLPASAVPERAAEIGLVKAPQPSTVWLILRYGVAPQSAALEKIEVRDMAQCEMQGVVWESSKRISNGGFTGFECLEGK